MGSPVPAPGGAGVRYRLPAAPPARSGAAPGRSRGPLLPPRLSAVPPLGMRRQVGSSPRRPLGLVVSRRRSGGPGAPLGGSGCARSSGAPFAPVRPPSAAASTRKPPPFPLPSPSPSGGGGAQEVDAAAAAAEAGGAPYREKSKCLPARGSPTRRKGTKHVFCSKIGAHKKAPLPGHVLRHLFLFGLAPAAAGLRAKNPPGAPGWLRIFRAWASAAATNKIRVFCAISPPMTGAFGGHGPRLSAFLLPSECAALRGGLSGPIPQPRREVPRCAHCTAPPPRLSTKS